jgi:hypothetical protein
VAGCLGRAGNGVSRKDNLPLRSTRLRGCAVARLRGCAVARLRGCAVEKFPQSLHANEGQSLPKRSRNYKTKAVIFFAYFTLMEMSSPAEGVIGLNQRSEI